MKITAKRLWAAAAATAGLAATSPAVHAAGHGHGSGGHWSGPHGAAVSGGGHWNGGSHWNGGGHWDGGHSGGWRGGHWGGWHSSVGFYFGVPLFWGPWWDPFYAPGYYAPYYGGERVVYREVVREPVEISDERDMAYRDGNNGAALLAPPSNPLATNYCPSAKAYFPQVRSCPEGWKLTSPTS